MVDEMVGAVDASSESRTFLKENVLVGFAIFVIFVIGSLVLLHFQLGLDIPLVGIKNFSTAAYWGQIGDFVGGILNPILSFIALLAVVINLRMQSSELKIARAEAREAQETQAQQTKIFRQQSNLIERQSFESVFFGLLQLHSRNVENLRIWVDNSEYKGAEVFGQMADRYSLRDLHLGVLPGQSVEEELRSHAQRFYNFSNSRLGHYFRTLYELLLYVDNLGNARRTSPLSVKLASVNKLFPENLGLKRTYAGIISASFNSSEVECVLIYCMTVEGEAMRKLCEKYGLLKHVSLDYLNISKVLFSSSAFK